MTPKRFAELVRNHVVDTVVETHRTLLTSTPQHKAPSGSKHGVRQGRLILDEPTDLPEGTEVALTAADDGDELDDGERAALHAAIDEGRADALAGRVTDAAVVIARLRARG
jgi:hypothetical protein